MEFSQSCHVKRQEGIDSLYMNGFLSYRKAKCKRMEMCKKIPSERKKDESICIWFSHSFSALSDTHNVVSKQLHCVRVLSQEESSFSVSSSLMALSESTLATVQTSSGLLGKDLLMKHGKFKSQPPEACITFSLISNVSFGTLLGNYLSVLTNMKLKQGTGINLPSDLPVWISFNGDQNRKSSLWRDAYLPEHKSYLLLREPPVSSWELILSVTSSSCSSQKPCSKHHQDMK